MQVRRLVSAALCIAATAALAGCGGSRHAAATSSSSSSSSPATSVPSTTSAPVSSTGTSSTSSTTTTTSTPSTPCSSLSVIHGKSSGAAGTIALGFVVRNLSATTCVLDGFPTIRLVPASGIVHPVVTHTGAAAAVTIVGEAMAGFVLEYGDEPVQGQTTCPAILAVKVTLPNPGAAPMKVPVGFSPCGAPDISVSAVLSQAQYKSLVG